MQPANEATNAALSGQVSESKWAVRLSERSSAAGGIKREEQDIPLTDVQRAYFAQAESS